MDQEEFKRIYSEPRNGCDAYIRHPLARAFVYTDGVQELAGVGCYWLLDVLATELPAEFRKREPLPHMCVVKVRVSGGKATILGEFTDDDPNPWRKQVDITDLPEGEWLFFVTPFEAGTYLCLLPSEY